VLFAGIRVGFNIDIWAKTAYGDPWSFITGDIEQPLVYRAEQQVLV
jgi:hypothetical protein